MSIKINKQFIRHRMVDLNIENLSALSLAAGLHRITVSAILRRGSCSLETLAALATALECQPGELLQTTPPADHDGA